MLGNPRQRSPFFSAQSQLQLSAAHPGFLSYLIFACHSRRLVQNRLSIYSNSTMRPDGTATPSQTTVREGLNDLDDKRIKSIRPLIPPQILMEDYPLTMKAAATVLEGRKGCEEIVNGQDDRLLVVVGPCSVHDVKAALEYAKLLKEYADGATEDLHILMRVYFEKVRLVALVRQDESSSP